MTFDERRGIRKTKRCGDVKLVEKKANWDVHTCVEARDHDGLCTDGKITWQRKTDEG